LGISLPERYGGDRSRCLSAEDDHGCGSGNQDEPQYDKGESGTGAGAKEPVAPGSRQYIPCTDRSSGEVMSGGQGPAADGGAVDADGPASLLLGLELFVHSVLFSDDGSQGVGHLLELLLVRVVELVHPLGERPVYDVIAAIVPGGCLMYHGDDFPQEGELLVL